MTEFDPEKFEEKYVHYFEELEAAYSSAFQQLHGRYDSAVLQAIDRQVLPESEPFYEDGEFRVELPEDYRDRVEPLPTDQKHFETVLQEFLNRIEQELEQTFETGE